MRVAGSAGVRLVINGKSYSTKGELTAMIQNLKREAVPAADGEIHYAENVIADTISGQILLVDGLRAQEITSATNVSVQAEFANHTAVLRDAFFSGDATMAGMDGVMDVEFSGRGRFV